MVDEILPGAIPDPPGAARPRAYLTTIYGLYARDEAGWLSVSNLIRMLAQLDVDETAVRSSISRLKRRGILRAERVKGSAGYALSPQAQAILARGDRHIFTRPRRRVTDGWILVVFSVPESERKMRHLIRSRLSGLGYGTVGPRVWVAPAHLREETADVLEQDDLMRYVDLFRGDYLSDDAKGEVASWWDLESIDHRYRQFLESQSPVLAAWQRRRGKDDEAEAFTDYVRALTAWRRLSFLDPGLPPELLPEGWTGEDGASLFRALRRRLEGPAHRFVDKVRYPLAG